MKLATHIALLGLLTTLTWACEPAKSDLANGDKASFQEFLTAEDFQEVSMDSAWLCLHGTVAVEFAEAGDTFGFPFAAQSGDRVAFETTGARDLDTVLMLFGPKDDTGYYGRYPLALDDDGGAGLLSKITPYELKDDGEFIVIVSTYGGQGVGQTTLHIALNDADGCTDPNDPGEPICCVMPDEAGLLHPMPMPEAECADIGGEIAPIEVCEDPLPGEEVCCVFDPDAAGIPGLEQMIVPEEHCVEMGGEPLPREECEGPQPGEIVCCLYPDPDGNFAMATIPELECVETGGMPHPLERCNEEPWTGEMVCCLYWDPAGVYEMAELPGGECLETGGEPHPIERCEDPTWLGETVCCLLPNPDGTMAGVEMNEEECLVQGGAPAPVEECGGQPPADQRVCCLYMDENGVYEMAVIYERDCLETGGEMHPVEVCDDPTWLGQTVCCLLVDVENGQEITMFVDMETCELRGGAVVPNQECRSPEPVPVCCLFEQNGELIGRLMPDEALCLDAGGEPGPEELCAEGM